MTNISVSPAIIARKAPPRAYEPCNEPRALAPPAMSNARAAGTGSPIASRNTAAKRTQQPCTASPEIQDSMPVIDSSARRSAPRQLELIGLADFDALNQPVP